MADAAALTPKRGRGEDADGGDDTASLDESSCPGSEQRRRLLSRITVGTRLSLLWPDDDAWYDGVVAAHYPNDWQPHVYRIDYDDGESETIDLATEQFRILNGDERGTAAATASSINGSTAPDIKSLTVCIDDRRENWRSPPTYYGGEDFAWPDGWIEVQRVITSDVQQQQNDPDLSNGRRWAVEFHPPPKKGGRSKVCRSLDEAKQYIERQNAQKLKKERQQQQRDEAQSRRSGRARTNPNQTPTDPTHPPQGTPADLNKIMKRNDRLSDRMRRSILLGAVLARKKDLLHINAGFLGADGRMYPDLRQAFGKHVGLKQCALCKSRVQGNWFCRITHGHLDKPDHDGGHSAEEVVDLFRCSVAEVEEKLWGLLPGGGKIGSDERKVGASNGFESNDWSMNVLSEDLLSQIASFLPSLSQLVAFCKTSQRGQHLLYHSVHSERLFRGVFLRAFGKSGARGNFEPDLTWQERWTMVRDLRRGLTRRTIRPPGAVARPLRETVGVLHPRDERESLFYDNPDANPDAPECNGYFGATQLNLPSPPNAAPGWKPPLVLTGDFNGIRIFASPSELFYQSESNDDGGSRDRYVSVGDDEGGGQVLSLVQCDRNAASSQNGDGTSWTCCYIGYMSGRVAAISATLTAEEDGYTFAITESVHSHDSEVTALAFLQLGPNSDGEDPPVLFSACCAGKVYFYPTFSTEGTVLAFANLYECPIFSMASTIIQSGDRSYHLLCTGDRDGNIRLWLLKDDWSLYSPGQKFAPIHMYKSSAQRGTGYHLVTRATFVHDNLLVTGTNNGDVRIWQLQVTEDPSRAIGTGPLPRSPFPSLELRYDLSGIHNGAVELLVNVGDVLLSSGGNDGKIVGHDIATGLKLGEMQCHPGTQPDEHFVARGHTLRSCVVDMVLSAKDGTFVSLCRDGSLTQLQFS